MAEMHVELVSPERVLFSGEATAVVARPEGGDAAFLPGHAPFLGLLGIGMVKIVQSAGLDIYAAVHGGFIEVRNNRVTILSDVAELASDIDVARAQVAREGAEKGDGHDGEVVAALRRATVRLEVAAAGSALGASGARH